MNRLPDRLAIRVKKIKPPRPEGARIVQCAMCRGKGGFKMKGPCFACDFAAHPAGDSCTYRQCANCAGKGKVYRIKKVVVTFQRIDG